MRTALFSWLAAKATGGSFILRIDDTDQDRNNEAAVQPILDGLQWLGLTWDEFYRQSERSAIYAEAASLLMAQGLAREADNGAILLNLPADQMPRNWRDEVGGDMAVTGDMMKLIDGLPLIRGGDKLGQATYQFASIVDDYAMDVSFIVRGVDHIANTPKQIAIWQALELAGGKGKGLPKFAHVGLIFKEKRKMSKRDGAASVLEYRDRGYDPDAIFNFLLRLGWGPKEDNKANSVMNRERALELFLTAGNMRAANANFDGQKLDWFDRRFKGEKARAAAKAAA
ncbi:glutamate--tRNA ligase family protein [Methylobacterium ajmalii]|uniref:Glutamate--tRNA ligase family protein n=1 Tax=Methylobacterium ajmalii TaxID=2738439 RepID=A0ABV0A695_9HYPH